MNLNARADFMRNKCGAREIFRIFRASLALGHASHRKPRAASRSKFWNASRRDCCNQAHGMQGTSTTSAKKKALGRHHRVQNAARHHHRVQTARRGRASGQIIDLATSLCISEKRAHAEKGQGDRHLFGSSVLILSAVAQGFYSHFNDLYVCIHHSWASCAEEVKRSHDSGRDAERHLSCKQNIHAIKKKERNFKSRKYQH